MSVYKNNVQRWEVIGYEKREGNKINCLFGRHDLIPITITWHMSNGTTNMIHIDRCTVCGVGFRDFDFQKFYFYHNDKLLLIDEENYSWWYDKYGNVCRSLQKNSNFICIYLRGRMIRCFWGGKIVPLEKEHEEHE